MRKLVNVLDHSPFRVACYFSLALMGVAAFALMAWTILSIILKVPDSVETATALGIISGLDQLVKPEPIENFTFLFSTGVGVFLFGLAGYRSAFLSAGSGIFSRLSLVLAIIWLSVWLLFMNWDSIIPPSPNFLFVAASAHSWIFSGLFIVMAALLFASTKLELVKKWRYVPLGICFIPLVILSRMVLTSNDDGYVNTSHYEVFIYPLIQDWLGNGIHLTQKSQYGMYPIFLRPLWSIFGAPTTVAVTFVMSVLLLFSNVAMLTFMYRFNRNKTMATIFGLLAIVFSLLFYPFWPGDAYFVFFPLRLVFPSLAMLFICMPLTRLRYPFLAYTLLSFGLFWNFESGLVGLVMYGIFSISLRFEPKRSRLVILLLRQLIMLLVALTFAFACVIFYYQFRFGTAPQFGGMLTMIKAFSAGVGAKPMPLFGAWIFHGLIYGVSIFLGVRWLFRSPSGVSREQAAALLVLAVMGLLWLRYYQGRSLALPLTFATFPAILCLGMLLDTLVSSLPHQRTMISRTIAVLIGGPLLASLLLWAGTNPVPQRELTKFFNEGADARLNLVVDQVLGEFELHKNAPDDLLLVVAPYAHLVQLKLAKPNRINVAGMCQFWFESEIDNLISSLNDQNTRVVVFDSNDICSMNGIISHPRVKPVLLSSFDQLPKKDECSIVSLKNQNIFVRKSPNSYNNAVHGESRNFALNQVASESSSFGTSQASAAVDGVTIGKFEQASTTHTNLQTDPWWQVDLGLAVPIETVQVWNRTDCCSERLKGYWIFLSDKPFHETESIEDLKHRSDVTKSFQPSVPCPNTNVRFPQRQSRYVRVQIEGTGYLSLAEVKVFGPKGKSD